MNDFPQDNPTPFLGWAIDRDYLAQEEARNGLLELHVPSRVGFGQTLDELDATSDNYAAFMRRIELVTHLRTSDVKDGVRFRLLDDDNVIYYGGAISRELIENSEDTAFAPLQWGEADAGCTAMEYRYSSDEPWRQL